MIAISQLIGRSSAISGVNFVASFAALSVSSFTRLPQWQGFLATSPSKLVPNRAGFWGFTPDYCRIKIPLEASRNLKNSSLAQNIFLFGQFHSAPSLSLKQHVPHEKQKQQSESVTDQNDFDVFSIHGVIVVFCVV